MNITEFASLIRRRWVIVLVVAGVIVAAVAGWTASRPTIYEASSTLYVSVSGVPDILPVELPEAVQEAIEQEQKRAEEAGESPSSVTPTPSISVVRPEVQVVQDEVMDSYAELGQSSPLLGRAAKRLAAEADTDPPQIAGKVTLSHPPRSQLLEVTARDEDPALAATMANAVGREVARSVDRWISEPGISSPIRVALAVPATTPPEPASPDVTQNIVFGLIAGLALGLAAAILREIFDTRLRDPATVRDLLDLPVLATIDYDRRLRAHSLLLQQEDLDEEVIAQERLTEMWARSRVAEEFRQLRVNLQFFNFDDRRRSITVTSSKPGEGKTTTAGNLAITLALAGESVALVDCDLRNPSVHRSLGLADRAGITDVLIGSTSLDEALVTGRRLSVLTAGSIPPNPTELLGSQAMADLLDELHSRFSVVIIDTPPSLPFADPAVLAPLTGATLLVVRMNHTNSSELERAATTLQRVDARLCGTVVNMVKSRGLGRSHYYSYYYAHGQGGNGGDPLSGSGFQDLVPRAVNGANGHAATNGGGTKELPAQRSGSSSSRGRSAT